MMTAKESLKVGVVGCGQVAQRFHIPSLLKIKNAEAVAVCDRDEELARRVAKRFHISRYYADFSEMLGKEELDMVHICTSPKAHATLSIQAMDAGCHVLVEKPMALSLREADEMVAASKENGVKLCVVHNQLFDPVVLKAKSMVAEGSIGDLTGIDSKIAFAKDSGGIADKDHWYHKLPGGPFGEELAHPIYLAMAFLGHVEPVAVYTKKLGGYDWVVADELRVILEGENGLATITSSCNWPKTKAIIDVFGTRMNLRIDLWNSTMTTYGIYGHSRPSRALENLRQSLSILAGTTFTTLNMILGRFHTGQYTLIEQFIESIQNDTEPPVTPEEGREVMRVYEGITAQIGSA